VHAIALWLRHYATSGRSRVPEPRRLLFSVYLILPAALGPGVYSTAYYCNNFLLKRRNLLREGLNSLTSTTRGKGILADMKMKYLEETVFAYRNYCSDLPHKIV
jgi:hypothetical protein